MTSSLSPASRRRAPARGASRIVPLDARLESVRRLLERKGADDPFARGVVALGEAALARERATAQGKSKGEAA